MNVPPPLRIAGLLLAFDTPPTSKLCSRADWMTLDDNTPGAKVMRRLMARVRELPDLKDADRLGIFELGEAISRGQLGVALPHIQKYWQRPAQLMFYRDMLQHVLAQEHIKQIDICPTQPFRIRNNRGQIIEAVCILIRHHPTGMAIGLPSHPELPPQVFRFVDFPDGSSLMEPELGENPSELFLQFADAFLEDDDEELAS